MTAHEIGSTLTQHACSKKPFNDCEEKFQRHVEAAAADQNLGSDKQDLWCRVLQVSFVRSHQWKHL